MHFHLVPVEIGWFAIGSVGHHRLHSQSSVNSAICGRDVRANRSSVASTSARMVLEDFVDLLGRVVVRRVVRQIADEPNLLENVRHAAFRYGTEFVGLAVSCHGLFLLWAR